MPKLNRPSLWTCAPYIRKMDAFLHMYFLQGIQENTYSLMPSFLASPTPLGPFQEGGRKFASGSALAKEQLKTLKTRLEFRVKAQNIWPAHFTNLYPLIREFWSCSNTHNRSGSFKINLFYLHCRRNGDINSLGDHSNVISITLSKSNKK